MESLRNALNAWNQKNDSLIKVQSVYATLTVAVFVVAAIVSLINPNLGQSMLWFAMILGLTFIGNGVIWALVKTFVLSHLDAPKRVVKPVVTRKK